MPALPSLVVAIAVVAAVAHPLGAETAEFGPIADATLIESQGPPVANGSGQFLFAGRTLQGLNGLARRSLLRFDLTSIPADALVLDVALTLNLVQLQGDASEIHVHRAAAEWTTGASDPSGNEGQGAPALAGDCTWLHASSDGAGSGAPWATPGGDFVADPSAAATTSRPGPVSWSGAGLRADVQAFIADPCANHGWFLLGDETHPGTSRRFDSGDAEPGLGSPPRLTVTWERLDACLGDLDASGAVDSADLGALLAAWDGPAADLDGSGWTDGADLGLLIAGWGSCPGQQPVAKVIRAANEHDPESLRRRRLR